MAIEVGDWKMQAGDWEMQDLAMGDGKLGRMGD